jgi:hypothetical protein
LEGSFIKKYLKIFYYNTMEFQEYIVNLNAQNSADLVVNPIYENAPIASQMKVRRSNGRTEMKMRFTDADSPIRKYGGSGFRPVKGGKFEAKRYRINPCEVHTQQDSEEFRDTVLDSGAAHGISRQDLNGNFIFQNVIIPRLRKSVLRHAKNLVWFGNESSTDKTRNAFTGVIPKALAMKTSGELKGASVGAIATDSLSSNNGAVDYFKELFGQASNEMYDLVADYENETGTGSPTGSPLVIHTTRYVADSFLSNLEDAGREASFMMLQNNKKIPMFRGTPIMVHPEWDIMLRKILGINGAAFFPKLSFLTFKDNFEHTYSNDGSVDISLEMAFGYDAKLGQHWTKTHFGAGAEIGFGELCTMLADNEVYASADI